MSSSRPPRDKTPEPKPEGVSPLPFIDTPRSQGIGNRVRHSINHNGNPQPAKKESASEVTKRVDRSLKKGIMKDVGGLAERVFHDLLLPVKPEEIAANEKIRLNNEWTAWPRTTRTITESDLAVFINLIGDTARSLCGTEPLYCSSMFENHAVPDPTEGTENKPDLIFFKSVDMAERELMRWMVIRMTLEIKAAKEKKSEAYKQTARYAQSIFNSQPGRRFVPAVIIVGPMLTLCIFDRSGPVRSEAFNLHQNPEKFLRVILGILFVAPEHLGFDAGVYTKPGGDEKYITLKDVEYKVDCIYHEPGIKGRGTVCYHGVDQRDNSDIVIKDAWVDVARQETEVSILEYLNKDDEASLCNSSGARVIPKIVAYEFCTTKRPVLIDGEERLEDVKDTTAIFRESRLELEEGEPKWAWSTDDKKTANKVEIRAHCRIAMTPYGKKLETFTSRKVLMRGLGDIVLAIKILQRRGIIHRDISFRNILLHQHGGALHGLLIDYDYAVSIDRISSDAVGERTGTLPFMSIDRLRGVPIRPHRYYDDLESMLYVLCWICTIYDGPCGRKRAFSEKGISYRDTKVAIWNGDISGHNKMGAICDSKTSFVPKVDFEAALKQFSAYFDDIMGCLRRLRQLLFKPSPDEGEDYEEKKVRLDKRYASASIEELETLKGDYEEIPITLRPPLVVLQSFEKAFADAAAAVLPEDEPSLGIQEAEETDDTANIGPRKLRELKPNAREDVESSEDDSSSEEDDTALDSDYVDEGIVVPTGPSKRVTRASVRSSQISLKRKSTEEPFGAPSSSKRSRTSHDAGRRPRPVAQKGKRRTSKVVPPPRRSGRISLSKGVLSGPGPSKLGSHSFTAKSDSDDEDGETFGDSDSDSS